MAVAERVGAVEPSAGLMTRALRALGRGLLALPWPLAAALPVLWAGLIWRLSSRPVPFPTGVSVVWELVSNLAHAPLFGLLCLFTAAFTWRGSRGSLGSRGWPVVSRARALALVALVGAYGVLDEWHQSRTPGRDSSAFDVVTDVVGAAMVLWIVAYLGRPDARERGLWARLVAAMAASVAAAALSSLS